MSESQTRTPVDRWSAIAAVLKAIGEPTRLQLIWLLSQDTYTVTELCALTGQRQQAVSHHLTVLKLRQLAQYERAGKSNRYSLTDAGREAMASARLSA